MYTIYLSYMYIPGYNIQVLLDQKISSTLISLLSTTGMTNLMNLNLRCSLNVSDQASNSQPNAWYKYKNKFYHLHTQKLSVARYLLFQDVTNRWLEVAIRNFVPFAHILHLTERSLTASYSHRLTLCYFPSLVPTLSVLHINKNLFSFYTQKIFSYSQHFLKLDF